MEMFILIVASIVALILLILSFLMGTFGITHIFGAPFVPTPKKSVREMLKFADFQKGQSIIDLGSGDGVILVVAVKEFGASKAIGYEIHPVLVWVSRLRALVMGISDKVETRNENFFKSKIEEVDVVAVYLWPQTMNKLREKIKASQKPETLIISRGFQFKGVKPLKKMDGPAHWLFLYRVEDL